MSVGPHVVITIHGIRTFGDWQDRLEKLVRAKDASISFRHFRYGYFDALSFLVPIFRDRIVRQFTSWLIHIVQTEKPSCIDIVGHSFGTYVIGKSLHLLKSDPNIRIKTAILAGSVLRSDFDWLSIIPSTVERLVNDCGSADSALTFSQLFVLYTGRAGRVGFVGMSGPSFQNRFSEFGHSDYFVDASGQKSSQYMERYWLPIISSDDDIEPFDYRTSPTALQGFNLWLTNNLEPVKIALYVAPFAIFSIFVTALYIDASIRKNRIEKIIGIAQVMEERHHLGQEGRELLQMIEQTTARISSHRHLLWIDDESTNEREIAGLEEFGFCTTKSQSTDDAMTTLRSSPAKFSAIVSDFKRKNDPKSGYKLIDEIRGAKIDIPIYFYVRQVTPEQREQAKEKGAKDETENPIDLIRQVASLAAKDGSNATRLDLITRWLFGCQRLPWRS